MEERLRHNIETWFSSFEDRIMVLLTSKLSQTVTVPQSVSSNTSGGCNSPLRRTTSNNCTSHYENKPIQIYWKIYQQNMKNFR